MPELIISEFTFERFKHCFFKRNTYINRLFLHYTAPITACFNRLCIELPQGEEEVVLQENASSLFEKLVSLLLVHSLNMRSSERCQKAKMLKTQIKSNKLSSLINILLR